MAVAPPGARAALAVALDQLAKWGTRLYEGKPISAALGFVPDRPGGDATLQDICHHDFSAVLSNGFDTMLTFDFHGRCVGYESLSQPARAPSYAPYRYSALAAWAAGERFAVVLNRLGEILVFKNQMLLFARRSAKWHFLTHEPVVVQMRWPYQNWDLRKAAYESCLDASFARTGACIGMVTGHHRTEWTEIATANADQLFQNESVKAKALNRMIANRAFHALDRRFRQELLAVDGATLLDSEGAILAVGAIVKIPGGSAGGGRLAAARALSTLGIGIKVSQDGGISGFHAGSDIPIFQVM
jgi:hypothetical protein